MEVTEELKTSLRIAACHHAEDLTVFFNRALENTDDLLAPINFQHPVKLGKVGKTHLITQAPWNEEGGAHGVRKFPIVACCLDQSDVRSIEIDQLIGLAGQLIDQKLRSDFSSGIDFECV